MATKNVVSSKQYYQSAGSLFVSLPHEDIQKLNEWLKRHNFYIEEKIFKEGGTTLAIGTKGAGDSFNQIISPIADKKESGVEGQFTCKDLIDFIDDAGKKELTGRSKKIMQKIIGVNPSAAEDLSMDAPSQYVMIALKDSPLFEVDYPSFWKDLVDRDHKRNLAFIERIKADPKKMDELLGDMKRTKECWDETRADWKKQREDIKVKEEEEKQKEEVADIL